MKGTIYLAAAASRLANDLDGYLKAVAAEEPIDYARIASVKKAREDAAQAAATLRHLAALDSKAAAHFAKRTAEKGA